MKTGIFLSYRRADVRHVAGRLAGDLGESFGKEQVFRDVDDISPGLDFTDVLKEALDSCAVMLVLIGPKWLDLTDASGNRRLDNPEDWARVEIATGLERNVRVVPVLVEGAQLPQESELPGNLKVLSRRQAIPLSDERWRGDVERLVQALRKIPELENAGGSRLSSEAPSRDDAELIAARTQIPGAGDDRRPKPKDSEIEKKPFPKMLLAAAGVMVLGGLITLFVVLDGGGKTQDPADRTPKQGSDTIRGEPTELPPEPPCPERIDLLLDEVGRRLQEIRRFLYKDPPTMLDLNKGTMLFTAHGAGTQLKTLLVELEEKVSAAERPSILSLQARFKELSQFAPEGPSLFDGEMPDSNLVGASRYKFDEIESLFRDIVMSSECR